MESRPQSNLPNTLVVGNRVGGRELPVGAEVFERRSPSNRDDLVTIAPLSSRDEVKNACLAAREAQKTWGRVPAPQRAQVLTRLAGLLTASKEDLSRFIAREVGKPLSLIHISEPTRPY